MGGRSSAELRTSAAGHLVFAGEIISRGGGFCSCRTLGDEAPLGFPPGATAVEVTATGDGRLYKVTLHTADSWSMSTPIWAHDFLSLPAGRTNTKRLPLSDFLPTMRGAPLKGHTLSPEKVTG